MKESSEVVCCMVFLREATSVEINEKSALNLHKFGRIPVAGEYIYLESASEVFYKVRQVVHTGWAGHAAELYVIEANDMTVYLGVSLPPI